MSRIKTTFRSSTASTCRLAASLGLTIAVLTQLGGCGETTTRRVAVGSPTQNGAGLDDDGAFDPTTGKRLNPRGSDAGDSITADLEQYQRDLEAIRQRDAAGFLDAQPQRTARADEEPDFTFNNNAISRRNKGNATEQESTRRPFGDRVFSDDVPVTAVASQQERMETTTIPDFNDSAGADTVRPPAVDQGLVDVTAQLVRDLRQEASYDDVPLRKLILLAAITVIDPQRAVPAENLHDLTEREQEIFATFQNFFADLGYSLEEGEDATEVTLNAVRQLEKALDQRPPMTIADLALCTSVRGFGDYTPFVTNQFVAQQSQEAIVYLGIENFTSALNENGEWVTKLSQQLSIYSDHNGTLVWDEEWSPVVDVSRTKRNDFFTVQVITLPAALSLGKYQLKVRLRDEANKAESEKVIEFQMVAHARMIGRD